MKKYMLTIGFLILFAITNAQEIGYSDKIEEAIANCNNCNICLDGKIISEGKVCIYFFWGKGCPHCDEEKPFLEEMKAKYPQIEIYDFEVYYNRENANFLERVCEKYGIKICGVPLTIIGDKALIGFVKKESPNFTPFNISQPSNITLLLAITFGCMAAIIIALLLTKKIKVKI